MPKSLLVTLCILLLTQCSSHKRPIDPKDLSGEWELIQNDTTHGLPKDIYNLDSFGIKPFNTLIFHEDKRVEPYNRRSFKEFVDNGPDFIKFLEQTTRFRIFGDSIVVLNPLDSIQGKPCWSKAMVVKKLTGDSLVLTFDNAITSRYKRVLSNPDTMPSFDAIVLSSSGCLGACPISSTVIKSDGSALFLGERFVEHAGLYSGIISKELYKQIQYYFQRADIKNIGTNFESPDLDENEISITFIKDGKIFKSINDYGSAGPKKLTYAYAPLLFINQYTNLKKVEPQNNPPYQGYTYRAFIKNNQIITLSLSEAFLLWNHLKSAKLSQQKAAHRFTLSFTRNALGEPSEDDPSPQVTLPEAHVSEIMTDGRLYTFYFKDQRPITLDLGFNFFDRNYNNGYFKPRKSTPKVLRQRT